MTAPATLPDSLLSGANISDVAVLEVGDMGGDTLPTSLTLDPRAGAAHPHRNRSNDATPRPADDAGDAHLPTPRYTGLRRGGGRAHERRPHAATPTNTPTPPTPRATAAATARWALRRPSPPGDRRDGLPASDRAGVVRIVFSSAALSQVKACAMAMTGREIPSTRVDLGVPSPAPTALMPIAIADLDRDGANDIAVGAGDRVIILKRTSGTFVPAGEIVVGGTVSAIPPPTPTVHRNRVAARRSISTATASPTW